MIMDLQSLQRGIITKFYFFFVAAVFCQKIFGAKSLIRNIWNKVIYNLPSSHFYVKAMEANVTHTQALRFLGYFCISVERILTDSSTLKTRSSCFLNNLGFDTF